MKLFNYLIILCLSSLYSNCWSRNAAPTTLRVLQMNIWHEGTIVKGGFEAIADEIVNADADIVFFSEVRNYNGSKFIFRMTDALAKRGKTYYGKHHTLDVGILSKYRIEHQEEIYPQGKGYGSILKATCRIAGHPVSIYSAHLDYKNYACYLPRGYDGATWKRLATPVVDPDSILAANRIAQREEAIGIFLTDAGKELTQGNIVLLGGDFNEPSHLDWQKDTRYLWDHNGAIVNWDCSRMLYEKGFKDAYRVLHPNPVTHPGFTFPSDNKDAPVNKLSWAPEADERDRIDFVYYYADKRLKPIAAAIVGPSTSIVRSERTEEKSKDSFLTPKKVWPSDHKAVLITFLLSE